MFFPIVIFLVKSIIEFRILNRIALKLKENWQSQNEVSKLDSKKELGWHRHPPCYVSDSTDHLNEMNTWQETLV